MNDNNWTKWASIAEIISSFAILVTIVFLVIEARQNNDSLDQNTRAILSTGNQNAMQAELEWLYKYLDYPELSTVSLPEFDDGLSRGEKIKRIVMAAAMFRMRENSWFQYKIGAIDQETWDAFMFSFQVVLKTDKYAEWLWNNLGSQLNPDFKNIVNNFMENQPF